MTQTIELKVENLTEEDAVKYQEILSVLAASGVLKLRNLGIIIHIDRYGEFQGIELDNYWPWRKTKGINLTNSANKL